MPATLEGQLVVAISSRALFDFGEENRVFEDGDDRAYMQLQLQREPGRRTRAGRACGGRGVEPVSDTRSAWLPRHPGPRR
jgi:hypothetical protein